MWTRNNSVFGHISCSAINGNIPKKLKSAQSSHSDTEPPVHGQHMWKLCWFASVICLKTKEDLTLQMMLQKYMYPYASIFKS